MNVKSCSVQESCILEAEGSFTVMEPNHSISPPSMKKLLAWGSLVENNPGIGLALEGTHFCSQLNSLSLCCCLESWV